jgi:hypothetical protein
MRVVSEPRELITLDYRPGDSIYLVGESAYVSLDGSSSVFEELHQQPPRPASFKLLGESGSVHVAVPDEILAEVRAQPKVKFFLMLDAYLHYMRKIRGDFLFIGGAASDSDTNLEFFLVKEGRVSQVVDKRLPNMRSSDFASQFLLALNDVLANEQVEGARIFWAYPLELPESLQNAYNLIPVSLERLGLKRLRLRPISAAIGKKSPVQAFVPGLVGLVAGGLIAAALIGYQWVGYTQLQGRFDAEVATVSDVYAQGTAMLNTLTSQQRMLDQAPAQDALAKHWSTLATAGVR